LLRTNTWNEDTIITFLVYGNSQQDGTEVMASSTALAAVELQIPLSIHRVGTSYILQWAPSAPSGMVLEASTRLGPSATWTVIASNPANPYTLNSLPASGSLFYRLRLP
jgi:hypothetical protein